MPLRPRILKGGGDGTGVEPPRERFIRIAEPRVANVIKLLRSLGALNRAEYGPPDQADVEIMIGAIEQAVGELREAFARRPGAPAAGFKFPPPTKRK
jgi:hypothetical protein